jgi:hypothetical protein
MPKPMLFGGAPAPVGFGAMPPPPPPASQFFIRDDSKVEGLPVLPVMASRQFSPPAGDDRRHHALPAKFATTMPMPPPGHSLQQTQEQQSRKARRCWSTELHRQFVAALRQLGGPQGTCRSCTPFY